MFRVGSALLLVAALGQAPFQCQSEPEPSMRRDERPGEALYRLAEEFRERGDEEAWRHTLRYLIRRHPSSRFAVTAEADLTEAGFQAPEQPPAEPKTAASPEP